MNSWFERQFKLSEHGTDVRKEIMAGITTFVTMAYIIFVNPGILSETGMPFGSVLVATCLGASLATFLMAFLANYPFALAPGMGLNAFFAFTVVLGMNIPLLIGGSVVTETVFSWPGIGTLMTTSINARDYPLIMGVTVIVATAVLIGNILIDLIYCLVDPRVKYS